MKLSTALIVGYLALFTVAVPLVVDVGCGKCHTKTRTFTLTTEQTITLITTRTIPTTITFTTTKTICN